MILLIQIYKNIEFWQIGLNKYFFNHDKEYLFYTLQIKNYLNRHIKKIVRVHI